MVGNPRIGSKKFTIDRTVPIVKQVVCRRRPFVPLFHMVTHLDLYRQRHLVVAGNSVLIFICCMLVLNAPQLKLRWDLKGPDITRVDHLRLWDPGNCSEFTVNYNPQKTNYSSIQGVSSIQTCAPLESPDDNPASFGSFVNAFIFALTGAVLALLCVFATVGPVLTKRCPWAATTIAFMTGVNFVTALATIVLVNEARNARHPRAFKPFGVGVDQKNSADEYGAHPDVGFGFSCLVVVLLCANFIMSLSTRGGIYDEGHHH